MEIYKMIKNLDNVKKGKIGENIAKKYLISLGMTIICSNYRTKFGEIDIIAKLENKIIFVEVKSRMSKDYGLACEAVDYKKASKITSVAKYYISTNNLKNYEIRFDVIEIYFIEEKINHIEAKVVDINKVMLSIVNSCNLIGIDGFIVNVEVDITRGMPCFNIVGLASIEIKEAKERVKSAIINSDFEFPTKRIVVNLSPADIKKEGSLLDLPISIGLLINYIKREKSYFDETIFVGELSLDGTLKKVRGILPIVLSAKQNGYKRIFIPYDNLKESSYVDGIEIIPIKNLKECISYINSREKFDLTSILKIYDIDTENEGYEEDFSDVRGNYFVKRGLEIAAAGNHNVILMGPPGCGKTMMARRIRTIMPDLDKDEMMEISKIYSIAGLINNDIGIINKRPFRAPHHSATNISLLGGGAKATPGEIVLAHRGVLFLDELAEFNRKTLDMLRQPIEDGTISISRLKFHIKYPCNTLIVAAMNPCPCGYFMSNTECKCSASEIMRYKNKISGPLLDRFDIFLDVDRIEIGEFNENNLNETSETIKNRVQKAKDIQIERFKNSNIKNNDEISSYQINNYCKLNKEGKNTANKIFNKYKLSNRSYTKLLKTARTIADLEVCEEIQKNHILEAFSYRKGYYKYFK